PAVSWHQASTYLLEPRIYTDGIPRGHATNETWKCRGRQAAKGVKPAGYFHPPDFVPEVYGCPLGIPLFTRQQTTDYNPPAATVAGQLGQQLPDVRRVQPGRRLVEDVQARPPLAVPAPRGQRSSSSSALACCKSGVSSPSVNQP